MQLPRLGIFDTDPKVEYPKWGRKILPVLLSFARSGNTLTYKQLQAIIKIPNHRNLAYPLGSILTTLKRISPDIPPIACLVVNQRKGIPGQGFYDVYGNEFQKLSKDQIAEILKYRVFEYDWSKVIEKFKDLSGFDEMLWIENSASGTSSISAKSGSPKFGGGESPDHEELKKLLASNPKGLGLLSKSYVSEIEYTFPSNDALDILFTSEQEIVGVEVKTGNACLNVIEIRRGIWQCIKYLALLKAENRFKLKAKNIKVILALGGKLPEELKWETALFEIDVIEGLQSNGYQR